MAIITPDLTNEIIALAQDLAARFSQPEFIPGCEVLDITDINLYATNNGWIEARCGQHNQQRVRWKSSEALAVSDFVDVMYFADRRVFEVWGVGGSTGIATGSGGYPFTAITVDPTNPNANYSTLQDAVNAASSGNVIIVGGSLTGATTITDKSLIIVADATQGATLTASANDSFCITITGVASSGCKIIGLNLVSTGGGTTSGCIKVGASVLQADIILCNLDATGGSATNTFGIYHTNSGQVNLIQNQVIVTSGTTRYAYKLDSDGSARVTGGSYSGTTGSFRLEHASAILYLIGLPTLVPASVSISAGTAFGDFNSNTGALYLWGSGGTSQYVKQAAANGALSVGTIAAADLGELSGGVWRHRADNVRVKEADLSTAYTNASAGDEIHLFPGTYTINALAINKAISIIGGDPLTTIIQGTTNNSYPLKITADNVRLENLTIKQTGGGGGGTNGFGLYLGANGVIAKNCIIQATGATAANYAVYHDAGTTGNCKLISCDLTATGGSAGNYGYVQASVATLMEIWGGSITAATNEIYGSNASAKVWLFGPQLASSNLISWAGTLYGRWLNASGVQYAPESNDTFSPQTFRPGYIISPTVASNNLTVALKTLDSADASAASPIVARIGDVVVSITAALSTTINAGTNWLNSGAAGAAGGLATNAIDYFVYLINETGASAGVKIGFARIPWAETMGDFTNTTTNEKYIAGNWTNFNTTDAVAVIGRFRATLSGTAAFNWSSPGTVINRPIFETDWLTHTPAITSGTGAITTVGTIIAAYQLVGRDLFLSHSITITTVGTAGAGFIVQIPFTALSQAVQPGRERGIAGKMLQGLVSTASVIYFNYDNTTPFGAGNGMIVTGGGVGVRIG